ncbi:MAG: hypothetical protein ACOYNU_05725 [Bacteroidales bacterium]
MNRFILLTFGLFSLVNGYSQVQYATYYNPMNAVTYNIQVETAKDDDCSIYVYAMHITTDVETGGFYIQKKNLEGFLADFLVAKQKYEAWTITAKENKIQDLAKKIEIPKSQKIGGFFKSGDSTSLTAWSINRHVKPVYSFLVTKDNGVIKYYLAIFTDLIVDPKMPLLKSSGYGLIFSSPGEAMSFYSLLQPEKINAFLSKQPKLDELFR